MTPLPSTPSQGLAPECRVLTRYLVGTEATAYVLEKYQAGHASLHTAYGASQTWFDGVLLTLARSVPFGPGLVDNYSRWFAPRSLVRHKLALLLAVLENSPDFCHHLTSANVGARWALMGGLMLAGFREGAILLIGVVVLGPLHLAAAMTRRKHR